MARPWLDDVAPGDALDLACGTGRWSAELAARGYRVTGVDGSPEMLAPARVAGVEFLPGDLHAVPVGDAPFDLVICALAVSHVPDLSPVFSEFARVLRPGGTLVVSDAHPDRTRRGSIPSSPGPDGEPRRIRGFVHTVGGVAGRGLRRTPRRGVHARRGGPGFLARLAVVAGGAGPRGERRRPPRGTGVAGPALHPVSARSCPIHSRAASRPFGNWSPRSQRHVVTTASTSARQSRSRSGSRPG